MRASSRRRRGRPSSLRSGRLCAARLAAAGVQHIDAVGGDTAREEARFFSYRRTCLNGEKQFGHLLSAICLAP